MSADVGRNLTIKKGTILIAAVRTKGVAINNEPIDITNDDDLGWRTLLEEVGQKQVDLTVGGVVMDDTLRNASINGVLLESYTITFHDGGVMTGDFFLQGYNENGEYNGAVTFDATLQSSGEVTYVAASA